MILSFFLLRRNYHGFEMNIGDKNRTEDVEAVEKGISLLDNDEILAASYLMQDKA